MRQEALVAMVTSARFAPHNGIHSGALHFEYYLCFELPMSESEEKGVTILDAVRKAKEVSIWCYFYKVFLYLCLNT